MSDLSYVDLPCIGWGMLIENTAAQDRQLRTCIDHGLLSVGTKQNGRLLFSLRERLAVDAFGELAAARIGVGYAAKAAAVVGALYEEILRFWNDVYVPAKDDNKPDLWLNFRVVEYDDLAISLRVTDGEFDPGDIPFPINGRDMSVYSTISLMLLCRKAVAFSLQQSQRLGG